jgi:AbrB family looped-hinge helix DNA binding protein
MKATIDKAGRLVIPKRLRDEVGLGPGEVEVNAYGAGLRVEPLVSEESLDERDGLLVIPGGGVEIDDSMVRSLRDAGQK